MEKRHTSCIQLKQGMLNFNFIGISKNLEHINFPIPYQVQLSCSRRVHTSCMSNANFPDILDQLMKPGQFLYGSEIMVYHKASTDRLPGLNSCEFAESIDQ